MKLKTITEGRDEGRNTHGNLVSTEGREFIITKSNLKLGGSTLVHLGN